MNDKQIIKSCGTCKHFRKFERTFEREDGAIIFGYCFKDARSDCSPYMGKGYPVWLPPDACGGACKAFKSVEEPLNQNDCQQHEGEKSDNGASVSSCQCPDCPFLQKYRKLGNVRTEYYCNHPNQSAIGDYFSLHKIQKMSGFLGFGKDSFPLKRTPKWCPITLENRHKQSDRKASQSR